MSYGLTELTTVSESEPFFPLQELVLPAVGVPYTAQPFILTGNKDPTGDLLPSCRYFMKS